MQNNTDSNSIIVFQDVHKKFPSGLEIISGVSFAIDAGSFTTFVGQSGCGKSTILKIIAGLEEASAGVVKLPPKVSVVFQSAALFPWLSVVDNVAFGLRMKGESVKASRVKADYYMEMVGLKSIMDRNPRDLSGGERQRVGIARALAVEPKVLVLDEPFSALDETTRAELHKDMMRIWKQRDLTIIMVSHQIEEAVELSEKVFIVENHTIKKEFNIDLSYPRESGNEQFQNSVQMVRADFPTTMIC